MECALLNLTGLCCPTLNNWTLACCGGPDIPVYQQCQNQTNCLGLAGACCPTADGKYLDCCDAVPDYCVEPGSCPVYSAVQYKLELDAAERTTAPQSKAFAVLVTTASTLLMVMVAVVAL
jgi:hypothetical protein